MSVYFATANEQDTHPTAEHQEILEQWVWRTFFTRRYSKRLEQLNYDITEINKLKLGQDSKLGKFTIELDVSFFNNSQFNLNTINSKTFILMLASEGPLNFISGSPVSVEPVLRNCNKKEFHHVFPRNYLKSIEIPNKSINCLTNFVMLSKADNNKLGGVAPSEYRKEMTNNAESLRLILSKSLCPEDIFHDNFEQFTVERSEILISKAQQLMKNSQPIVT